MPQITNFQTDLTDATWIDVNSQFTVNAQPDRLPDSQAISNSLFNLFNCEIGGRGRIFQPTYGSGLYWYLQEPLDQITANKLNIATIQAIQRWEPRILVDNSNSYVNPNYNLPGYDVRIAFTVLLTSQKSQVTFQLQK
jgi:phage baseplate assembly protein W